MTEKEKIIDILLEFYEEYQGNIPNRPMILSIYAGKIIDSLQEEPVSEKKCMFTKDNYTDEDRKVLCEECKEKCEYSKKEEPLSESIDFEQELYKAFGQIKDFTLGIAIAKRFYDMGRKHNEPVSEELEGAADKYSNEYNNYFDVIVTEYDGTEHMVDDKMYVKDAFEAGAKWQKLKDNNDANHALVEQIKTQQMWYEKGMADMKQQLMANAIDVAVHIDAGGYPYIPQIELYDYDNDVPLAKEGDKYKVILIKED